MGKHLGRELRSVIVEAVRRGLVSMAELDAHIDRFNQAATPAEKQAEAQRFMDLIGKRTGERCGPAAAGKRRRGFPCTN